MHALNAATSLEPDGATFSDSAAPEVFWRRIRTPIRPPVEGELRRIPELVGEIERRRAMVRLASHSDRNALARAMRVQQRTGDSLQLKSGERSGNCCIAASCTFIRLSRSPPEQTASCVTRGGIRRTP